jgi:hypothetical protein
MENPKPPPHKSIDDIHQSTITISTPSSITLIQHNGEQQPLLVECSSIASSRCCVIERVSRSAVVVVNDEFESGNKQRDYVDAGDF